MKSVEGIDRMFMSGTRASFTMEKGAKVDEAQLKRSVEKNKLKFVSLTKRKAPRAAAAYVASTPGLT